MQLKRSGKVKSGTKLSWKAGHRNSTCQDCGDKFDMYLTGFKLKTADTDIEPQPVEVTQFVQLCTRCGGDTLGQLVTAMDKHGNFWQYLFGDWNERRIKFCEANRPEDVDIPIEYREGQVNLKTWRFGKKVWS